MTLLVIKYNPLEGDDTESCECGRCDMASVLLSESPLLSNKQSLRVNKSAAVCASLMFLCVFHYMWWTWTVVLVCAVDNILAVKVLNRPQYCSVVLCFGVSCLYVKVQEEG